MADIVDRTQKLDVSPSPVWTYIDLQNKKQTGEIFNKINGFSQNNNARVFSFSSCREKEGVTTVLANLIQHIRRLNSEKKILVIDANLQAPALHLIFQLKNGNGLSEISNRSIDLSEGILKTGDENINVILSGKGHANLSGNIKYETFNQIFSAVKEQYDYIFIDSAPVLTSPDFLPSAEVSDIVFLVMQSLKVQREAALKAKTLLTDNDYAIGGVIFNRVQQVIPEWLYRII
jgi:capsular exopolysaccharide synthesis family protein